MIRGSFRAAMGLAVLASGCAAPSEELARAHWLRQTLILDNQIFLERNPEQAGGKLSKMGEQLYRYFRGTAPQYTRDATQPGSPGYWPSAYESAATRDVALVGDPHPENIGTYVRTDGTLTVDFNDFDAATFGPYGLDLRRLALGFWVAGEAIIRWHAELPEVSETLLEADRDAAARAVVEGYAAEIAAVAADPSAGLVIGEADPPGAVLADLLDGARGDGEEQEKLVEYTRIEGSTRVMFYGEVDPARTLEYGGEQQRLYEDTVVELEDRERRLVEELVPQYAPTVIGDVPTDPAALRIKGISRRYGAGVSSYPVQRYYVLIEGPSEALEDDVLLELKQIYDAVPLPGLERFPAQPFYSNGERVVKMQRALQAFDDDDPWLGWAATGGESYRVRWRTGFQRGVGVDDLSEDLAEGDLVAQDFVDLARVAGRLLARAHGRAPKQNGDPGAPAIAEAIGDDAQGLADEVMAFLETYAPRVLADHVAYEELLNTHGPRLGYRRR